MTQKAKYLLAYGNQACLLFAMRQKIPAEGIRKPRYCQECPFFYENHALKITSFI